MAENDDAAKEVKLQVNGKEYSGWKAVRVTRGIECVANSFDLEVSERWADSSEPWPINEEDECKLFIGSTLMITGHVDVLSLSYGAEDHNLGVSGRDITGNLVDCSAVLSNWEYRNVALQTFVTRVCDPFGIPVKLQAKLGQAEVKPILRLSIDPGDTAFEAIDRACRIAGLLAISDGAGSLVLARPGTTRCKTGLIEGQNILSASADYDATSRARTYLVLGQHRGSDEFTAESASHISAFAEDPNVRRAARTILIRPESDVTIAQAQKRAQWEASVRAARGDSVSVTVQGWTQTDGTLWPINALVDVQSPMIRISGEMLITQATYSLDDGGTTTTLTLRRPDAFTPAPVVPPATGPAGWKELEGGV